MSTVSASQNMAQPNQQNSSYELSDTPMKRKRGRPRKDGVSGSEPNKRNEQCTVLRSPSSNDGLVGQEVSCSFIGVFDAGYLLSVQVGSSGPILRGMVFDPHLSVPLSAENDVAPHLPMLRRNSVSPPVEGVINQGAVSSHASIAQKAESMQTIQDKETPTTSSFTSHVHTDLQQNMMEVTPSYNSHVPQSASETMESQFMPKTLKVFLEGAATETSHQCPLTSSYHLQSEAKSDQTPISAGLLDISMEAPASKPSNGFNPSGLSMVSSLEVSKPYVSDPSEVSEAVAHASSEPLNIRKEALSTTTEASLDVPFNISKLSDASKEAPSVVFKPSEASVVSQNVILAEQKSSVVSEKSSQRTEEASEDELLAVHNSNSVIPIGTKPDGGGIISVAEKLENAPTASEASISKP